MEAQFNSKYYEASRLISDALIVNSLKVILRKLKMQSTGRKAVLQAKLLDYLTAGYRRRDFDRINYVYNLVMLELNPPSLETPPATNNRTAFQSLFPSAIDSHQISTLPTRSLPHAPIPRTALHSLPTTSIQQHRPIVPTHTHQYSDLISKIVFKRTPFYEIKKLMAEPLEIATHQKEARSKYTMRFTFTSQDVDAIEHRNYRVYLLSALIDPAKQPTEYGLDFPQQMEVLVNNQFIQANVRGVKGKPGSATAPDITHPLTITLKVANLIEITVKGNPTPYAMFAYLVQPVSNEDIIKQIKSRPLISKQSTVQRIIDDNNDDDIQTLSTVLSLKCPLSYTKLAIPVRSIHCDHIECFDALSFLLLQKQASTWTCPICNKLINFQDLAVDEYSLEILEKTAVYDIDEIKIEPDGSWHIPKDARMLGDEDEDNSSESDSPTSRWFHRQKTEEGTDVVMLSDSEEDVPPPPRPPSNEIPSYPNNSIGLTNSVASSSGIPATSNVTSQSNGTRSNDVLGSLINNQTSGQQPGLNQNQVQTSVPVTLPNQGQRPVLQTNQPPQFPNFSGHTITFNPQNRREVARPHQQVEYNSQVPNNQGPAQPPQPENPRPQHVPVTTPAPDAPLPTLPTPSSRPVNPTPVINSRRLGSLPSAPHRTHTVAHAVPPFVNTPHVNPPLGNPQPVSAVTKAGNLQPVSTTTKTGNPQLVSATTKTGNPQPLTTNSTPKANNSSSNKVNSNITTNSNTNNITNNRTVNLPDKPIVSQPVAQTVAKPAPQGPAAQIVGTILLTNRTVSAQPFQPANLPGSNIETSASQQIDHVSSKPTQSTSSPSLASSSLAKLQPSTEASNAPVASKRVPPSFKFPSPNPKFPAFENFLSLPPWETSVFFKLSSRSARQQPEKSPANNDKAEDTSSNSAATSGDASLSLNGSDDSIASNVDKEHTTADANLQKLRLRLRQSVAIPSHHPIRRNSSSTAAATSGVQNDNIRQDSLVSPSLQSPPLPSSPIVDMTPRTDGVVKRPATNGNVGVDAAKKRQLDPVESPSAINTTITKPAVVSVSNGNKATTNVNTPDTSGRTSVRGAAVVNGPSSRIEKPIDARPVPATTKTANVSGAQPIAPPVVGKTARRPFPAAEKAASGAATQTAAPGLGSKRTIEVIDLTLSDDEVDDQPPAKR